MESAALVRNGYGEQDFFNINFIFPEGEWGMLKSWTNFPKLNGSSSIEHEALKKVHGEWPFLGETAACD